MAKWLAATQRLSCFEGVAPSLVSSHSHYANANALGKAWETTSYQVELGFFEVTGLCQFQLIRVFGLDIIYIFAWKQKLFSVIYWTGVS